MPRRFEIAVLPGDGVGPEVIREALRALEAARELTDLKLETTTYSAGAKYWLGKGRRRHEWDEETFERCSKADAILLGPIGFGSARAGGDMNGTRRRSKGVARLTQFFLAR